MLYQQHLTHDSHTYLTYQTSMLLPFEGACDNPHGSCVVAVSISSLFVNFGNGQIRTSTRMNMQRKIIKIYRVYDPSLSTVVLLSDYLRTPGVSARTDSNAIDLRCTLYRSCALAPGETSYFLKTIRGRIWCELFSL